MLGKGARGVVANGRVVAEIVLDEAVGEGRPRFVHMNAAA